VHPGTDNAVKRDRMMDGLGSLNGIIYRAVLHDIEHVTNNSMKSLYANDTEQRMGENFEIR